MKYIVYTDPDGAAHALLFHAYIDHDRAAALVRHAGKLRSAGFVYFLVQDGQVRVQVRYRSASLDLDSQPEDAEVIAVQLNLDPADPPRVAR